MERPGITCQRCGWSTPGVSGVHTVHSWTGLLVGHDRVCPVENWTGLLVGHDRVCPVENWTGLLIGHHTVLLACLVANW